jgi:hypothetical protein
MSDPFQETGEHYTSLNEHHQLGRARDINSRKLTEHLIQDHGVHASDTWAKGTLGKIHTLTHAILAYPELRELMGLPEHYGTGNHIPPKH